MKTTFQLFLMASMVAIFLDITSCSERTALSDQMTIEGQFVDIVTHKPVQHMELSMKSKANQESILSVADQSGYFEVSVPKTKNHEYSLYVHDARYRLVSPNRHITMQTGRQVWYVLPLRTR